MTKTKMLTAAKNVLVAGLAMLIALSGSAFLFLSSAPDAHAATVIDERTVRVDSGDTLSGIALTFMGDASRFDELADINNIANPNLIFPGQLIVLPEGEDTNVVVTPRPTVPVVTVPVTPAPVVVTQDSTFNNLFSLLILDRVLDNDRGSDRDLVDLVILSELFVDGRGTGTLGTTGNFNSLFQLVLLDRVLDDGLDTDRDLVDLVILSQLFNTGTTGVNGSNNLFQFLILDEVLDDRGSSRGLLR